METKQREYDTVALTESELEKLYLFKDRQEVLGFVSSRSYLLAYLLELPEKVEKYFGNTTKIRLEVITDPEVFSDVSLFGFILTDLKVTEALDNLQNLDRDWWDETSRKANHQIELQLRFK
jgi:hypothetical protein